MENGIRSTTALEVCV